MKKYIPLRVHQTKYVGDNRIPQILDVNRQHKGNIQVSSALTEFIEFSGTTYVQSG